MRISFLDFWDGFQPANNFLFYLFREIYLDLLIVEPSKADLIIFSVFGTSNRLYKHCKKIFFTGENVRPNFNECDYSITFDFESYQGRNVRIPLWYHYIDWFGKLNYGRPNYLIPECYLYETNEFSKKNKSLFCSAVYSNPATLRNEFVNFLSRYKKIECYGKIHGFHQLVDGEKEKLDIISNYKFNICFENSSYAGYQTEKLLQAKISGCIPIYFGDYFSNDDFRQDFMVRVNNPSDFEFALDLIKEIDNNFDIYKKYTDVPLFNKKIDLDLIKNQIKSTFKI